MKAVSKALLGLVLGATISMPATAQERPAKRVADIVGVALAEYEKGVDSSGKLVLQLEFDEAVTFLGTARGAAAEVAGSVA